MTTQDHDAAQKSFTDIINSINPPNALPCPLFGTLAERIKAESLVAALKGAEDSNNKDNTSYIFGYAGSLASSKARIWEIWYPHLVKV